MAESKNLKQAVHSEVKEAEHEAKTGNVKTVPESKGGPQQEGDMKQSLGDWRESQAAAANSDKSLPTGTRRSHPPQ